MTSDIRAQKTALDMLVTQIEEDGVYDERIQRNIQSGIGPKNYAEFFDAKKHSVASKKVVKAWETAGQIITDDVGQCFYAIPSMSEFLARYSQL